MYSKEENTLEQTDIRGEQYTFLAIDKHSKLIVNWLIGKHTTENAELFMQDLKSRLAGRVQLTTDNWRCYSGIDGGAVSGVFGHNVDYATETKRFASPGPYMPRRVISLRRRRKIGNPDMKVVTINHVERTNLSARTFMRRLTRCTLGFSKKLENMRYAVALFAWHFNFCRLHSAHGQTPAMSAKLADHVFSVSELLNYQN